MKAPLVVLVRTHSPGNLGSAARACKCFGAELALLSPIADRNHPDATALASGAEDLLARAPYLARWEDVEERADDVVALTALRGRRERGLPPRITWAAVRRGLVNRRMALVFGPERGGLTTDELRRCTGRLTIATRPAFPTLNLAQAVAVALALAGGTAARPAGETRASAPEVTRLFAAFREALGAAGYAGAGRNPEAIAELESLLRRAGPTSREVTLFLGALAALRR